MDNSSSVSQPVDQLGQPRQDPMCGRCDCYRRQYVRTRAAPRV